LGAAFFGAAFLGAAVLLVVLVTRPDLVLLRAALASVDGA
jgi:hypothetical protein